MAKALSSAYLPISATVISETIYQACVAQSEKIGTVRARLHLFRPSGVLRRRRSRRCKIYEERDIVGPCPQRRRRGSRTGMRRFADHPLVGEVRGVGLIAAVELVRDKASKASFDPKQGVGALFAARAQEHGLILRALGDTVAFCPPLIITRMRSTRCCAASARRWTRPHRR